VDDFAYDDFERGEELIAIGEASMRAALPAVKKMLGIAEAKETGMKIGTAGVKPSHAGTA
jgi:hypothetical protein